MSKVYNKIVSSNVEPSKNDIWIQDGQMKTFGKEGWKAIGGEVSKEDLNELVKGGKEVYNVDLYNWKGKEDHDKLFEAVNNKKIICCDSLVLRPSMNFENDRIEKLMYISATLNTYLQFVYYYINENYELSVQVYGIPLTNTGDGTKFLSDNGRYKTIDILNNEPYIFEYSEDLTNIGLDGFTELEEAISSGKKIIIRYNSYDITPMINIPIDGVLSGTTTFSFISNDGQGEYLFKILLTSHDYSVSTHKHTLNFQ